MTRGYGEGIKALGLGNFEAAIRADEVPRKIAFRVLLQHEMTGVVAFDARHGSTIPPFSFCLTGRTLTSSYHSPSWADSRDLRLQACRDGSQAVEALRQKNFD